MKGMFVIFLFISFAIVNAMDVRLALVTSGTFDDLGFNYMENSAMINTEYALGLTDTILIQNITTEGDAITQFEGLVQSGYNYIISGSTDHGTAAQQMAAKYPGIYWAQKGGKTKYPNLASFTFDNVPSRYLMGYYTGLMTKTGNVGFVVPGPNLTGNSGINSFYVGAKNANPDCTVFQIKIGSYLAPDLAKGATLELLKHNIDVVGQIQDDTTITRTLIDLGYLGIGNTGYPLSNVYGGKLGMGVVQDWTLMYMTSVQSLLTDSWIPAKTFKGTYSNGQLSLDKVSYLVPEEARQALTNETQKVMTDGYYYFCGPLVAELSRTNASSDCLTLNDINNAAQLNAIVDLGYYTIPLEEVALASSTKLQITVITSIALGVTGIIILLIFGFRTHRTVKVSSITFTVCMCIGCIMVYCSVLLWIQIPTVSICNSRVWLASLGYAVFVGSLLIKNIRILMIFDNNTYTQKNLKDWKLLCGLLVYLLLHVVLLIIWHELSQSRLEQPLNIDFIGTYKFITICTTQKSGDDALYAILVFHGISLLFGCYLSYNLNRKVKIPEQMKKALTKDDVNESSTIALILYGIALALFIIIPLNIAPQTTLGRIVLICVSMLFTISASLALFFVPKFIRLVIQARKKGLYVFTTQASTSGESQTSKVEMSSKVESSTVENT